MKTIRSFMKPENLLGAGKAIVAVAVTTAVLLIAGRDTLGEAVIALLLLVPVAWSTTRWGPAAGMAAAVAAAVAVYFFFFSPFFTFTIARLGGSLVVLIFSVVAGVV